MYAIQLMHEPAIPLLSRPHQHGAGSGLAVVTPGSLRAPLHWQPLSHLAAQCCSAVVLPHALLLSACLLLCSLTALLANAPLL